MTKRKRGIWTVETEDGHEHKRRLAHMFVSVHRWANMSIVVPVVV